MLALIFSSCFLINLGITSFHPVPSWTFLDSVWFVFQSYFGVRLILSVITHFLLSSERSDLFPHLMCAFPPSPHLICRVWKWLACVSWRLRRRKLPRAWSCWTSSSKMWQSRWVRDLMCCKLFFWIPPRPLLNVILGFYIATAPSLCPTSFLTEGTPGRNAWLDLRTEKPSCLNKWPIALVSWSLSAHWRVCAVFLKHVWHLLISRNTAWDTVRASWVLSQVIALSSPLIFSFQNLGPTQKPWEQVWSFVLRLCFP